MICNHVLVCSCILALEKFVSYTDGVGIFFLVVLIVDLFVITGIHFGVFGSLRDGNWIWGINNECATAKPVLLKQ
jgi:hypothetical protein